jgi:hypothetical protein
MELYIQIKNGQPFEHPIFGDNFCQAFPHIDVNNLPAEFARFERIEQPNTAGPFQIEEVSYQWVDGVVKDVWTMREMTDLERADKTTFLTEHILRGIVDRKTYAQDRAVNAPDETTRQAFAEYLVVLNAYVLEDVVNPNIPFPPKTTVDGIVLPLDTPGSAPNVIG